MRIFLTRWFARWAAKESLSSSALRLAVQEIESGLVDAQLGGNVVKKRVATAGRGKSGGLRTLLAIRLRDKSFFIYGYAKNQRDNINETELRALKALASQLLNYDDKTLAVALNAGELVEINHEET